MLKRTQSSFLLSLLTFLSFSNPSYSSQFKSDIFKFDDPDQATGLHVSFSGDDWQAEDIKEEHIEFHQALFGNEVVMQGFADGQTRDAKRVEDRCLSSINDRFAKGHPHGMLTISDPATSQPFMHLVGGGGERKGTSEIAYAIMPDHQGKKFGTRVMTYLVQKWSPEVRRIGLGNGLDPIADEKIIKAFQCLGESVLDQLDATASPSNVGSWRILDGLDFTAAKCGLTTPEVINDYSQQEFSSDLKTQYSELEQELLKLFNPQSDSPLKSDQRYQIIDSRGIVRTFSKYTRWDRIKFHFERQVE